MRGRRDLRHTSEPTHLGSYSLISLAPEALFYLVERPHSVWAPVDRSFTRSAIDHINIA